MASASSLRGHLLSCSLCCEDYNDDDRKPKYLACHHTFCRACLHKWTDKTARRVECPNCRKPTEVDGKGVDGLQTNHSIAEMRVALNKQQTPEVREEGCSTHAGQPMFFHCVTCDKSICRDCTVLDHKESNGHVVQNVADANTKLLAEVEANKKLVRHQLESIAQDIDLKINATKERNETLIKSKKADYKIRIEATMQEERECVERMIQQCTLEVDKLKVRKEDIIKQLDALPSTTECRTVIGKSAFPSRVGKIKQALSNTLIEIRKQYPYSRSTTYRLNEAVACQRSSVIFTLYSDTVKLITSCDAAVKITNEEHDEVGTKKTALVDGSFKFSFIPKASGEHKVELMIEGKSRAYVVCMVKANNPIRKFGNEHMSSPEDIVVDTQGNYYVSDRENEVIHQFSSSGTLIKQFKVHKTNNNSSVEGIALNELDNAILYIPRGSSGTNRGPIRRIDLQSNKDTVFIQYKMQHAVALTVNSQQHVIVVDTGSKCLLLFDKDGTLMRKIGDESMFKMPFFLTTDSTDNIYVSDRGNHCILKFSLTGELLLKIGKQGSGKGELDGPQGVATNGKYIAVAEHGNRRIQLFHMDGGYAGIIGSEGDRFNSTGGVVITNNGDIAVVDYERKCMKVYRCDMLTMDLH